MRIYIVMQYSYDSGEFIELAFDLEEAKRLAVDAWIRDGDEWIDLKDQTMAGDAPLRLEYDHIEAPPVPRVASDVTWKQTEQPRYLARANVLEMHSMSYKDDGGLSYKYHVLVVDQPCPELDALQTLISSQTTLIQNALTRNEALTDEVEVLGGEVTLLQTLLGEAITANTAERDQVSAVMKRVVNENADLKRRIERFAHPSVATGSASYAEGN